MSDITLTWDPVLLIADWSLDSTGALATGHDLQTAVLFSLFSDRLAEDSFVPTDGSNDRRGWWCDTLNPYAIGSRLWELSRAKKTSTTGLLNRVNDICTEALQWFLDAGIAASVVVSSKWLTAEAIGVSITVTEPAQGPTTTFNFSWAWASL